MKRQMWALVSEGGYLSTVCNTRAEVIAAAIRGSEKSWKWWKRNYGLRAIKVMVSAISSNMKPTFEKPA